MPIICLMVRENHKMVREMSGKSQGILWRLMAGHPVMYLRRCLGCCQWYLASGCKQWASKTRCHSAHTGPPPWQNTDSGLPRTCRNNQRCLEGKWLNTITMLLQPRTSTVYYTCNPWPYYFKFFKASISSSRHCLNYYPGNSWDLETLDARTTNHCPALLLFMDLYKQTTSSAWWTCKTSLFREIFISMR